MTNALDPWRRSFGRNTRTLVVLLVVVVAITALYSILFHVVAAREGLSFHWFTGFYWTIETMSTLGYGDIVFESIVGRAFAVLVVSTGIVLLLILLPFSFVQFFYAPWLEARNAARAPRRLPADASDHVILTDYGPVELALIRRLTHFRLPYVVLVPDVADALELHDEGIRVMVGDRDDPATYRRARVDHAALVAATLSDTANANVALTVRECSGTVPIVATAGWEASVDILERAGCQQVVQLGELLGQSMASRISGHGGKAHVIGELDDLLIAEAAAANTALVGRTLDELTEKGRLTIHVAGVWEHGRYQVATSNTTITNDSVLLLSGSREQIDSYDREIRRDTPAPSFVVIVGGGRVGRATSRGLVAAGIDHRIVDNTPQRAADATRYILGDATDVDVLRQAGIDRADSVAMTTHNDDVNVYVTLFCRRLRPNMQILSRATLERNVSTLHQAGADHVLSYVPMEANAIFDVLRRGNLLLAAEGLESFTVRVPRALVGQTAAYGGLLEQTGCNVLAVRPAGQRAAPPNATVRLETGDELILIGDQQAEQAFFARFRDVRP